MITDEALYPINHAWRVHWAADSSGLMRPSIIDARFNDESASGSITEQRRAAVNTHLIHDAISHDDFRLFFNSPRPRFFTSTADLSIAVTRRCAFTRRVSNRPLTINSEEISGLAIWIVADRVARNNKRRRNIVNIPIEWIPIECLQNYYMQKFRLARAIFTWGTTVNSWFLRRWCTLKRFRNVSFISEEQPQRKAFRSIGNASAKVFATCLSPIPSEFNLPLNSRRRQVEMPRTNFLARPT